MSCEPTNYDKLVLELLERKFVDSKGILVCPPDKPILHLDDNLKPCCSTSPPAEKVAPLDLPLGLPDLEVPSVPREKKGKPQQRAKRTRRAPRRFGMTTWEDVDLEDLAPEEQIRVKKEHKESLLKSLTFPKAGEKGSKAAPLEEDDFVPSSDEEEEEDDEEEEEEEFEEEEQSPQSKLIEALDLMVENLETGVFEKKVEKELNQMLEFAITLVRKASPFLAQPADLFIFRQLLELLTLTQQELASLESFDLLQFYDEYLDVVDDILPTEEEALPAEKLIQDQLNLLKANIKKRKEAREPASDTEEEEFEFDEVIETAIEEMGKKVAGLGALEVDEEEELEMVQARLNEILRDWASILLAAHEALNFSRAESKVTHFRRVLQKLSKTQALLEKKMPVDAPEVQSLVKEMQQKSLEIELGLQTVLNELLKEVGTKTFDPEALLGMMGKTIQEQSSMLSSTSKKDFKKLTSDMSKLITRANRGWALKSPEGQLKALEVISTELKRLSQQPLPQSSASEREIGREVRASIERFQATILALLPALKEAIETKAKEKKPKKSRKRKRDAAGLQTEGYLLQQILHILKI